MTQHDHAPDRVRVLISRRRLAGGPAWVAAVVQGADVPVAQAVVDQGEQPAGDGDRGDVAAAAAGQFGAGGDQPAGVARGALDCFDGGDVTRFPGPRQLTCWAGLTPRRRESDTTVVSGTEAALSSALRGGRLLVEERRSAGGRVGTGARLRAMAVLQEARPELTHAALLGVVDGAAAWLDQDEDDLAAGLMEAAGGEAAGRRAWRQLVDSDQRAGSDE
jgi:Transposase IS116/IS110/IS902 family